MLHDVKKKSTLTYLYNLYVSLEPLQNLNVPLHKIKEITNIFSFLKVFFIK